MTTSNTRASASLSRSDSNEPRSRWKSQPGDRVGALVSSRIARMSGRDDARSPPPVPDRHLERGRPPGCQTPRGQGREVAEMGIGPAGEDRRRRALDRRRQGTADGVGTGVDSEQPAGPDPVGDRGRGNAEREQLDPRDASVLAERERDDVVFYGPPGDNDRTLTGADAFVVRPAHGCDTCQRIGTRCNSGVTRKAPRATGRGGRPRPASRRSRRAARGGRRTSAARGSARPVGGRARCAPRGPSRQGRRGWC